jgi:small subunit ribosomal protein S7
MAGRITKADEQLRPDPRYGDKVLARFINCVMRDGKKSVALRVVYDALDDIKRRLEKEPDPEKPKDELELFHQAIERVKPYVEVRSKRIGGANYQVPMPVNKKRQQSLAFRWILQAARGGQGQQGFKGRPMSERLAEELYAAAKGEGKAMSTRDQVHRMADANKAFAHFA